MGVPNTISLGFIDDVAYATAATSADEINDKLQVLASRELRWGKRHGAAFDKKKSQWLLFTHWSKSTLPLDLNVRLGSETLSPQPHIKWLGVTLDPKLSFKLHGQAVQKKGTLSLLKLRSLTKSGWGISAKLFHRLVSSLVHSRTDYASLIWHSYGKQSATTHALQRLDNTAQRLALGAFRSHPLIFLQHDSNSISALQRLDSKSDGGVIRLLSLPSSNPAASAIRQIAVYPGNRHLHPLSHTLSSTLSVAGHLRSPIERIDPTLSLPGCPDWLTLCVDQATGIAMVKTQHSSSTLHVFCAGSHNLGTGSGAAAHSPAPPLLDFHSHRRRIDNHTIRGRPHRHLDSRTALDSPRQIRHDRRLYFF